MHAPIPAKGGLFAVVPAVALMLVLTCDSSQTTGSAPEPQLPASDDSVVIHIQER